MQAPAHDPVNALVSETIPGLRETENNEDRRQKSNKSFFFRSLRKFVVLKSNNDEAQRV